MPPRVSLYRHFMKNWFAVEVCIYPFGILVDAYLSTLGYSYVSSSQK